MCKCEWEYVMRKLNFQKERWTQPLAALSLSGPIIVWEREVYCTEYGLSCQAGMPAETSTFQKWMVHLPLQGFRHIFKTHLKLTFLGWASCYIVWRFYCGHHSSQAGPLHFRCFTSNEGINKKNRYWTHKFLFCARNWRLTRFWVFFLKDSFEAS